MWFLTWKIDSPQNRGIFWRISGDRGESEASAKRELRAREGALKNRAVEGRKILHQKGLRGLCSA